MRDAAKAPTGMVGAFARVKTVCGNTGARAGGRRPGRRPPATGAPGRAAPGGYGTRSQPGAHGTGAEWQLGAASAGQESLTSTCRMAQSLLFGVLSLSPPLLVVSHRPPAGLGSTVRSRPYVPVKYARGVVVVVPVIRICHSWVPRSAAMYNALSTMARPLGEAPATGQVCTGARNVGSSQA